MLKILKYLRRFWLSVVIICVLLVIQAACDLALPSYTSAIVDTGIQQGGIAYAVPEAMRQETYAAVLMLSGDEGRNLLQENYRLINKDSLSREEYEDYVGEYPLLETEPLYICTADSKKELEKLDKSMALSLVAYSYFTSAVSVDGQAGVEVMPEGTVSIDGQAGVEAMPEGTVSIDGQAGVEAMPEGAMTGDGASAPDMSMMLEMMKAKLGLMSDSIISQMAINIVKAEYIAIGRDMDQIRLDYLWLTGFKMLALTLAMVAAAVMVGFFASRVAAGLGLQLRRGLFKKVVSFSNAEMDKFSTASLITRSTNDIQQVQMVAVMLLRIVIYAPILGVGGIIKVANTKTGMGWIIGVAVGIILLLVIVLISVAMPKFKKMQTLVDKLNLVAREILSGLPVIRAFSRERYEEKRFEKANRELMKTQLFTNRAMAFMMPIMMIVMNGISILIIWNGGKGIDAGDLQVGDMMAFITYTMQIVMSFLMITMVSIMLPRAGVAAERIDEVLNTEPSIHDPENAVDVVKDTNSNGATVTYEDVTFCYSGAEEPVLSHISFTAEPGKTTAIIGSTGSGKSTLVNLLPRFYDVTEGRILIDGRDIREMKQQDLRSLIGFVPQKATLFTGTIASNLRFGNERLTEYEMEEIAEIAQSADFIEEKEEKYDSDIAQGGTNISGGQKQRLSIARAIAKKPPIYVFDDSFSALDYKTDTALRRALHEKVSGSTQIIVAQRISTILRAEQIIVLDEGKVAGIGTHAELLAGCPAYQEIARSQLSEKELSAVKATEEAASERGRG